MAKAAEKKAPAKKAATKSAGASGGTGKQDGLQRPVKPSKELAEITGDAPLPRSEVVSKMWAYIKKNELQNPENKREILADDKLEKVFGVKKVTMFEMNKHLSRHLTTP